MRRKMATAEACAAGMIVARTSELPSVGEVRCMVTVRQGNKRDMQDIAVEQRVMRRVTKSMGDVMPVEHWKTTTRGKARTKH